MNFDNEIKLCATILKYRITNGGVGGMLNKAKPVERNMNANRQFFRIVRNIFRLGALNVKSNKYVNTIGYEI